ncbi:sensor histidine kinase YesM [Epilithonimonas hungarica]|uniref:sensor histidine kinase n=1 Tax=Epilithonimonas hungarica TaxID=454006 RepID=UPI0027830F05|nr:sensor histidine kinase [Epilithonimonas hungarica]MDP9957911.1 sensor histidine kinase YesM [Epilithonimonas hungarica]
MKKRFARHFIFWFFYLILEVYTEYYWMEIQYKQSVYSTFVHVFLEEFLTILLIKMPMGYLMLYFISRFRHKKSNIKLIISLSATLILFSVLGYVFLVHFIVPFIYPHLDIVGIYGYGGILNSFMDKIFLACVMIALYEYSASQKLKQREILLMKEKTEAELNFLKSQINPHFLFNTLNNIYSLAREKSDKTADVILKLSSLLRFMLYETKEKFIPISKEIQFMNTYLEIQKIRFDERLKIEFQNSVTDNQELVLPLILLPFLENAFKHGASESTDNKFININLELNNDILNYSVINSFEKNDNEESKGIGLINFERQLKLVYNDFSLQTEAENNIFTATLYINLNSYEPEMYNS